MIEPVLLRTGGLICQQFSAPPPLAALTSTRICSTVSVSVSFLINDCMAIPVIHQLSFVAGFSIATATMPSAPYEHLTTCSGRIAASFPSSRFSSLLLIAFSSAVLVSPWPWIEFWI